MELARARDLFVVEDCAIALGATVDGRTSACTATSAPSRSIPSSTSPPARADVDLPRETRRPRLKQRAFGIDKAVHRRPAPHRRLRDRVRGLNYRLGEIQAAMGVEQLERLPGFLEAPRAQLRRPSAGLCASRGSDGPRLGRLGARASHYCLVAMLDPARQRREADHRALEGQGNRDQRLLSPKALPDTAFYRTRYGFEHGSCPNATRISEDSLAFPVAPTSRLRTSIASSPPSRRT